MLPESAWIGAPVPVLDQISIYPIKSCSGIALDQAEVEERGFPYDRRWMLIDAAGQFISQRKIPLLSQFKITIQGDQMQVSHGGFNPLTIDLNQVGKAYVKTRIWKDSVMSQRVSPLADKWFSKCLDMAVRLVHMDEKSHRPLPRQLLYEHQDFEVSFADGYPYLLTNQASLDDLNGRLKTPVGMDRFRPNLVVQGFDAYAEDSWKRIRIADVDFLVVKPCARCQVTTIDQKTGESSKEPLKTLATYRKRNGKVMFGMNLLAVNQGRIELNAPVTILE